MNTSTMPRFLADVLTRDIPTVIDGSWPVQPPASTRRRRRRWGLAETCAVLLGTGLLPWAFLLGLHIGWLL